MRIAKIKIPLEQTKSVNLKEIDLTKKPLGSVVALVGKNGSGKSRILNFVKEYPKKIDAISFYEDYLMFLPINIMNNVIDNYNQGKNLMSNYKKNIDENEKKRLTSHITQSFPSILNRLIKLSDGYIKVIDNDELQKIKSNINNNILSFEKILSNVHFDNYITNPELIINNKPNDNILLNEINEFNNNETINYLKKLSVNIVSEEFNLYIKNRNQPEVIKNEIKKNKSFQLFEKFQKFVKEFLGKEFSYKQSTTGNTIDSVLHFNDQPFNIGLLSPGQKTLFAYAILFFYLEVNSKANINECIIIIDEPEKHLHPEAQIKLIDAIKSIIKDKGQLWIATHSVHILSHLEYDEILMVKDDGIILPSRTTPGNSFNDLMGLEDHIGELSSFINSISEWAYGNFMKQCFVEPDIIFGNNPNDPQFKLFKEFIEEKSEINLLDYGAGKGRIGYTIKEDNEIKQKIKYSAFDPNLDNEEFLKNVPNIERHYTNQNQIPEDTFDCVLLCNVLHEISPKDWKEVLNNIKRILNSDGYLIIIEDKFLPKGEDANEFGYLILGTEETKKLLDTDEVIELKLKEKELEERIIFNVFKEGQIEPNEKTILESIKLLNQSSLKKLKTLRKEFKENNDVSIGRKYANETQLYINSLLAIEDLSSKTVKTEKL
ncbi:AAA family ATPase [Flavobacterium gelidilacus]|uniref:AAA family ATPase n=1 Tax=Flavobacterium gelidilacus TaxID=206041 RepID=UPI00042A3FF7|nr:AAA family ATPase [Flavobacterium gelidilacus]